MELFNIGMIGFCEEGGATTINKVECRSPYAYQLERSRDKPPVIKIKVNLLEYGRWQKISLQSKRELLEALKEPYRNATYSGRNRLQDGFQTATGYSNSRKHAIKILNGTVGVSQKRRN